MVSRIFASRIFTHQKTIRPGPIDYIVCLLVVKIECLDKMLKTIFIATILGLCSFGCSHVNQYNAYAPATIELSNSKRAAFSLKPSVDNSMPGVTIYSEPYKLEVLVPYNEGDNSISLNGMKLTGNDGVVVTIPDQVTYLKNIEGTRLLTFEIEKLGYQSYTLSGDLALERSGGASVYAVDVALDTDYSEETVNKFWERLMGI